MDENIVNISTDEQLQTLGVQRFGDVVALRTFCQGQLKTTSDSSTASSNLMNRIREKLGEGSKFPKRRLQNNRHAAKSTRRIELGWMMDEGNGVKHLRSKSGGGTRHLTVGKLTTVSELERIARELFFPDGFSQRGNVNDFFFVMTNFDGMEISDVHVTIEMLYEKSKQKMLRLYLRSTKKTADEDEISGEVAAADAPAWCHQPSPQPGVSGVTVSGMAPIDADFTFPDCMDTIILDDINHYTVRKRESSRAIIT